MTRVFESNGPDIKIRGTASHVAEKYVQLARDARSSGDPVAAENYYQHAEHYFRLIAAAQEQFRQNQPQPRTENEMPAEDGDDEGESFSNFGAGTRLRAGAAAALRAARQPASAATTSARASPISRATSISRASHREHRPQPQFQPPQPQPQPVIADSDSVDRLPSFITGPQPQISGGPGGFEGGERERFPRRRRRPHGPRPEGAAAPAAPSDDFNPGNE